MTSSTLKTQIDIDITNKTISNSISPTNIGGNLKAAVDYTDQEVLKTLKLASNNTITSQNTFTTPSSGTSIIVNNTGVSGISVVTQQGNGIDVHNTSSSTGINVTNDSFSSGISVAANGGGNGIEVISTGSTTCMSATVVDNGNGFKSYSYGAGTGILLAGEGTGKDIFIDNIGSGTTTPITTRKGGVIKFTLQDTGAVTATQFVKSGGTALQYLMADGSTSSNPVLYKTYVAILSQSGTSSPTPIVLENTIGNIIWTRTAAGNYSGTLNGAFTTNKTHTIISGVSDGTAEMYPTSNNVMHISTRVSNAGIDGYLNSTCIEIRVYN